MLLHCLKCQSNAKRCFTILIMWNKAIWKRHSKWSKGEPVTSLNVTLEMKRESKGRREVWRFSTCVVGLLSVYHKPGLLLHLYSDSSPCCFLLHLIFLVCNGSSIFLYLCICWVASYFGLFVLLMCGPSLLCFFCFNPFSHFFVLLSIDFNSSFYSFLSALYFGISLILDL